MLRHRKVSQFVALAVVTACHVACENTLSPTGPSDPLLPTPSDVTSQVSLENAPKTPEPPPAAGACDTIGINRAGITTKQVSPKCFELFVPVSYSGPGTVWVHVWNPELNNGTEVAIGRANSAFRVVMPGPGTYDFQLAVEVDSGGDRRADDGLQCDVHRMTVTLFPDSRPCPAAVTASP